MIHEAQGNRPIEMLDVGEHPRVVTMQAGGNDAGFYNVASNCIFHDVQKDYGGLYPDDGSCKDAINDAHDYLTNDARVNNLKFDVDATIREIFDKDPAKSTPDFKLYLIGYAHFFDIREEATACNDWSFNLPWLNIGKDKQKLNLDVRSAINGLVEDLNNGLRTVAANWGDKVGYIDTTPGFDDHRFCQVGHSQWDQYFGNKVYLWNWLGSVLTQGTDGAFSERDPTDDEFQKWLVDGRFTDDPAEVTPDEAATISSPHQGASPGSALRPFHPKKDGHGAMAAAIIRTFMDEITDSGGGTTTPPPAPTKAMQAVLQNHIDEVGNANYWSFFQLNPGEVLGYCGRDAVHSDYPEGSTIVDGSDIDNPPMPNDRGNPWKFTIWDEECTYANDGSGAGTLDCPTFNGNKVNCEVDSRQGGGEGATEGCEPGLWVDSYHPAVYCAW
jgi:hypothetical protein